MKIKLLALLVLVSGSIAAARADQPRLQEEAGREAPRDTNLIQVEPTILDEQYYISGRCEHKQFVGNTLPAGAPIPDTDGPVPISSILIKPSVAATPPAVLTAPAQKVQPPVVPASAH